MRLEQRNFIGLSGLIGVLFAVVPALIISGQTRVDLKEQARNVDFSKAASTKPFKSGTVTPSCTTGDVFFKTDAVPGSNIYLCVATNTWIALSGASVSSVFGQMGAVAAPITTPDTATPPPPAPGNTTWYTKDGKLCSLDPAAGERCTGGGITTADSPDGTLSATVSGNILHVSAGPSMATIDGNNAFGGDNRYSELCTANAAGTVANRWVQRTSSGCQTLSSTTQPVFGLAGSTTASAAVTVYRAGRWDCAYSNTAVRGNWATATSDGRCADSGVAASSTAPAGAVAVAEASGTGNVLVSMWPSPGSSSQSSPVLTARTVTTSMNAGDTDIDSVSTTIAAGGCVRVVAWVENMSQSANATINLNLGTSAFQLQTGSQNILWSTAMICNAAGVQNSQLIYAASAIGPFSGAAGQVHTTAAVDTSVSTKISISGNAAQQLRMNWSVERLY